MRKCEHETYYIILSAVSIALMIVFNCIGYFDGYSSGQDSVAEAAIKHGFAGYSLNERGNIVLKWKEFE